jgi:predicted DNA-binding transcriptional regulator YafY
MPKSANQKLKILYLMDWLLGETDDITGLSMTQILARLDAAGIRAERKSIYDDIDTLRQYGLDILTRKGKSTEYYVGSREYELPELKLLVDAVQSSKFITQRKSTELIRKLEALTSKNQAKALHRQVYVANRIKTQNESIYYNVDALHSAIAERKKSSFQYFDFNVDKKRVYRRDGERYVVNPLGLSWDDENYYLITYSEKYEDFTHYRVDRMTAIEVEDEARISNAETKNFNVAEYCKRVFGMFEGDDVRVELSIDDSLVNAMIDRFGKDVVMYKLANDRVRVIANIKSAGTFFGWLAQFGDKMRIDAPDERRGEYVAFLKKVIKANK